MNCAHLESLRENGLEWDPEGSLCTLCSNTMAGETHTWDFCSLDTSFNFVQLWLCSLHELHLGSDLLVRVYASEKTDVICQCNFLHNEFGCLDFKVFFLSSVTFWNFGSMLFTRSPTYPDVPKFQWLVVRTMPVSLEGSLSPTCLPMLHWNQLHILVFKAWFPS